MQVLPIAGPATLEASGNVEAQFRHIRPGIGMALGEATKAVTRLHLPTADPLGTCADPGQAVRHTRALFEQFGAVSSSTVVRGPWLERDA